MEPKKLGQEPAFPMTDKLMAGQLIKYNQSPEGMSKRFYAACAAMQGIISAVNNDVLYEYEYEGIVDKAYKFADELLKQENQ